ncbi:MAG: hypothetical protein QM479_15865 [Pseudomonadota bacterium]
MYLSTKLRINYEVVNLIAIVRFPEHIKLTRGFRRSMIPLVTKQACSQVKCSRKRDTIARVGGDEFIVICKNFKSDKDISFYLCPGKYNQKP